MRTIFVDTAALIALGNTRDQFHVQAVQLTKEFTIAEARMVTTNAVLLELTNAFSAARYKPTALPLLDLVRNSPNWTIVMIDKALLDRGIEKFKRMDDKDWSLVDCIGMIVAKDFNTVEIFTNDHHFEHAGFTILMK